MEEVEPQEDEEEGDGGPGTQRKEEDEGTWTQMAVRTCTSHTPMPNKLIFVSRICLEIKC